MYIIDRRLNPGGKSLANRQRFLRRTKALVQRAVRDSLKDRSIKELDQSGEVSIARDSIHEPTMRRGSVGDRDYVLPGNREYVEGDRLPRPQGAQGQGSQAGDGDGEDEFRFVLTREEYLDLFLDDLELPDLAKRKLTETEAEGVKRAGYTTTGSPSSLAVSRTMRNALSRRIALKRPKAEEVEQLDAEIDRLERMGEEGLAELALLREERERITGRRSRIAYIDPLDIRYRRYEPSPKPVAQAVMFCLMDVSGSMSEQMKDLAKRFYALLHLFLTRCYKHVDIVFIRHTDHADEVDEETFFYSQETGGTVVSSALEKMMEVVRERYRPSDWNIYVAQASDGDNFSSDNQKAIGLVKDAIIPISQYFAYLEVGREEGSMPFGVSGRESDLWRAYAPITGSERRFVMRRVTHRREIYPVFRELFQRGGPGERVQEG